VIGEIRSCESRHEGDLGRLAWRKVGAEEVGRREVARHGFPGPPPSATACGLHLGRNPEGPDLPGLGASARLGVRGVQLDVGLDPRRGHLFEAERRSGQMGLGIDDGKGDQHDRHGEQGRAQG